jgi:hypothetical protein
MKNKIIFYSYCLLTGFIGFITRCFTDDLQKLVMVMYMGGSLLMIAAIYYWSLEMFEKEMKYHFSLRTFIKKGLRISGLIGIFAALSVILQIAVFGNEVLEGNLAIIHIDPRIKPEDLKEAIDGAEISNSWYVLAAMQLFRSLTFGLFYTIIISALFVLHPYRVKDEKRK